MYIYIDIDIDIDMYRYRFLFGTWSFRIQGTHKDLVLISILYHPNYNIQRLQIKSIIILAKTKIL